MARNIIESHNTKYAIDGFPDDGHNPYNPLIFFTEKIFLVWFPIKIDIK